MSSHPSDRQAALELWAGFECTVARIGDRYIDQNEISGHAGRVSDLDLLADLGVRAVRYPILWERTAPHGLAHADWSWADERLESLRALGIRPIVGLVHHGSGPRHTSLVHASFAEGLAEFARAVATRYPWVDAYTPVNEPLTTARFSGLYGHWYPHGRDDRTFARALITQCRAVALAMQAIREVTPAAQLVQTEDLGKTYATPALAYQAAFDNERRWLTFDLLTGRLGPASPLWGWLCAHGGIDPAELEWFRAHPCPPDVVGINHYLSSERFLDERRERYPAESHGSNGRHTYADVLAARVLAEGAAGPATLLREAWDRYGLALAVTEAHNGCTREEQLRWVHEVWSAAQDLRAGGANVRAVTAWSLLGAYDWDSLLTREASHYEPGVYDLRGPHPRPTALAALWRGLGAGYTPDHPVFAVPGWWRRPERLHYPPVHGRRPLSLPGREADAVAARPLLITGATGMLAQALARLCDLRGLPHRAYTHRELDIADPSAVERRLAEIQPWAVINAAGYGDIERAERERRACRRANVTGPAVLAGACARHGIALLSLSCDRVFDGTAGTPYVERDPVTPIGAYARSKADAETLIQGILPSALVVRTGPLFSPWDRHDLLAATLRELAAGRSVLAVDDAVISPTYVHDLVQACLDLLIDGESGVWHLVNEGATTWPAFIGDVAERAGLNAAAVLSCPARALHPDAPRHAYRVLGSARGLLLPALDDAIARYLADLSPRALHMPARLPA